VWKITSVVIRDASSGQRVGEGLQRQTNCNWFREGYCSTHSILLGGVFRCVAHGGDFTFSGKQSDLLWIKSKMEESYELKMRAMLGDDFGDDKEITILNRLISWKEGCIH